jgi:hypothetical protein
MIPARLYCGIIERADFTKRINPCPYTYIVETSFGAERCVRDGEVVTSNFFGVGRRKLIENNLFVIDTSVVILLPSRREHPVQAIHPTSASAEGDHG